MEKLVKLLNEYGEIRKYNNVGIVEWVEHTKWNLYWKYWENTWSYMVVISKEYGFIKWLVDNDKIDKDIVRKKAKYLVLTNWLKYYEWLIMELSIQDNPIEFLCEILK